MSAHEALTYLRPLATYERFRHSLHNLGYHYSVSTAGFYSSTSGKFCQTDFYYAFQYAIGRHSALGFQIRDDRSRPWFIRLDTIDLTKALRFEEITSSRVENGGSMLSRLEKILSDENSRGFTDPEAPLWRAVILHLSGNAAKSDRDVAVLVMTWHHVIADGKSGQAIHGTIIEGLENAPDSTAGIGTLVPVPWLKFLPTMDDIFSYPSSWSTWLSKPFSGILSGKGISEGRWTGSPHLLEGTARTLIRIIEVDAEALDKLRKACKRHGTTMTALLQTVVGTVIFEEIPTALQLRCATAIQLRRFIPKSYGITDCDMGVWIDSWSQDFSRDKLINAESSSQHVSWRTARKSKSRINYEISKGQFDLGFSSLRDVDTFEDGLRGKLGKQRENSFSIINLGVCSEPTRKKWQLDKMVISQSAHVNGSCIQFCAVSTQKEGMTVCLNWQEGVVAEDLVEQIVVALGRKLDALIE